ncbi:MAG: hypothetical protein GY929_05680, partial [Actinomycetia bacterium]|nr:hypothetical protein [Actinomycetes bacterium]
MVSGVQPAAASGAAPTAAIGGPYVIGEGDPLVLNASGSSDPEVDPLTYAWDLDNDGQYDDANGVGPTVPWIILDQLGVGDDGGHTIGLEVNDGTSTDTDSATLTITNTEPTVTLHGAGAVPVGDLYHLAVEVDDPGADTVATWTINWGDGEIDTGAGSPGLRGHTYSVAGLTQGITVRVTDEDGSWTTADVVAAHYDTTETLRRSNAEDGSVITDFATTGGALTTPYDAAIGPDGLLYVSGFGSDNVVRFDPSDNTYVDTFVTFQSGGLQGPKGLAFGPDGNLYVVSSATSQVLRYSAADGSFVDIFVAAGTLVGPGPILFAPSGVLLVGDGSNDDVETYDASTGASLGLFASLAGGTTPTGLASGPGGNVFVTLFGSGAVEQFDSAGTSLGAFVSSGLTQAHTPRFGPDGDLWVSDYW